MNARPDPLLLHCLVASQADLERLQKAIGPSNGLRRQFMLNVVYVLLGPLPF
jgi:hypothetical protein